MDKDGNAFDLTWAPPRYVMFDPRDEGVWRLVTDGGTPVGVVWTDYEHSAGVLWITQTDAVAALNQHFISMNTVNAPATSAYLSAPQVPGVELSDEQSGPLSGVEDELSKMMESAN